MIALIQRVTHGSVTIEDTLFSDIGKGYVILLGVFEEDTEKDIDILIPKILNLRIVSDDQDKMNKSILDVHGEILVVSQFTLCADLSTGRRPSFVKAKEPKEAKRLYELFVKKMNDSGLTIKTGTFGAMMKVDISNDGPVTIILDSTKL